MTDKGYIYDEAANEQIAKTVRAEVRRLQNPDTHRPKWIRSRTTPGTLQDFTVNPCDPCDCCSELNDSEVWKYLLKSSRNCCGGPVLSTLTEVSPNVFQSEAFNCTNTTFSTEWTLDVSGDPITATLRTPSGDVVYQVAAADWVAGCGGQLELSSSASMCTPAPAGCICVGPATCKDKPALEPGCCGNRTVTCSSFYQGPFCVDHGQFTSVPSSGFSWGVESELDFSGTNGIGNELCAVSSVQAPATTDINAKVVMDWAWFVGSNDGTCRVKLRVHVDSLGSPPSSARYETLVTDESGQCGIPPITLALATTSPGWPSTMVLDDCTNGPAPNPGP